MSGKQEPSATRRRMLVSLAATGAALAGAQAVPSPAEAHLLAVRSKHPLFVFRFSTRGHSSCNACKSHHRYVIASHRGLLNASRAHPGCNCPIVRQVVRKSDFRKWFPSGEGVIDLRVVG